MKINFNCLEEVEILFKRENRVVNFIRRFGNMWNMYRFDYLRISEGNRDFWKIVYRIIDVNIGKFFNKVFFCYCKKVRREY